MPGRPPVAAETIDGLVLCRVSQHRFAVPARDVTYIDDGRPESPWVGRCYAQLAPPEATRALWAQDFAVRVDSVEISAEALPLLPVPQLIAGVIGGALVGFVETHQALWPVLSLGPLSRFLEAMA